MVTRPVPAAGTDPYPPRQAPYPVTPVVTEPPELPRGNGSLPHAEDAHEVNAQDAEDSGSDWDAISDDDLVGSPQASHRPDPNQTLFTSEPALKSSPDLFPMPLQPDNLAGLSLGNASGNTNTVTAEPSSPQSRLNSNPFLRRMEEQKSRTDQDKGKAPQREPFPMRTETLSAQGQAPILPQPATEAPAAEPHKLSLPSPSANAPEVVDSDPFSAIFGDVAPPQQPQAPPTSQSATTNKQQPIPKSLLVGTRAPSGAPQVPWKEDETLPTPGQATAHSAWPTPASPPQAARTSVQPSSPITRKPVRSQSGDVSFATVAQKPVHPQPSPSPAPLPGSSASGAASDGLASPQAKARQQRNEVYQIKKVRWHDTSARETSRTSPILIQNANGPCPLLALVNALVLSTPANTSTALVETLRSREQVSLGLLLDAVFDELTSGRRGEHAAALPDVAELYSFLITLHTGMNVNPRFVSATEAPSLLDLDDISITIRPGEFEQTKEMRLYGTFSIPLIHGWMPPPNSSAYSAFHRCAPTYEDAQNMQFREEELEEKLGTQELSPTEQTLYIDLASIKEFFRAWPTQLTAHGLGIIKHWLAPAQFCILFRNDHFSTIYKEPRSGQLMTLVTDAGYAGHEEIVWESLVDINGMCSEMYAGDFKSVSHNFSQGQEAVAPSAPVKAERGPDAPLAATSSPQAAASSSSANASAAASSTPRNTEQEDHDLALALQLQEEEEEREWRSREARKREDELSEQYLSSDRARRGPEDLRPAIPPRRSGAGSVSNRNSIAVSTTGPRPSMGELPTYEQAAAVRPFHPPHGHPSSEHAPRRSSSQNLHRRSTGGHPSLASTQMAPTAAGTMGAASGRRRTSARQTLVDQIPSSTEYTNPPGAWPSSAQQGAYGNASGYGSNLRRSRTLDSGSEDREKCVVM